MSLVIGDTVEESVPQWPRRPRPSASAPNVVLLLLDDVGYAQLGCFGGSIRTPTLDRLAAEGLRYTDFHTTALCSPTRAALLTGRNSHSVGFGHVTERQAGFPGYSMRLPDSASTLGAVLTDAGYRTCAVGKWHLTPPYETGPQGPFDRWPLGRGFQRFYGFLGGSTDQFRPELFRDNAPVAPPHGPEEGYHLTTDLVEQSIGWIRDSSAIAPAQPFFLYLATGAGHAPHQAPREWIDRYRGEFDHGWDEERERILARQIELGLMPEGTELGRTNHGVPAWAELGAEERRLYARMMEVYAGFLSHADDQIGRLVDHLEQTGQLDSTLFLVLSDNGASAEGGPCGSIDEGLYLNDRPQLAEDGLAHLDRLGGPDLYNHYPWGWAQAGNTPFRWYKQYTHAGGNRNGLIARWPDGGIPAGELRRQYHHVVDIAPTILDAAGIEPPATWRGVPQLPMHGVSIRYSFSAAEAPGRRSDQHYEVWGNRGFYHEGWMAVCRLQPDPPGSREPFTMTPFADLTWELYDHRVDPAENQDLAEVHPERVRALESMWWAAARRYDLLPVDTRHRSKRWPIDPPRPAGWRQGRTVFAGPAGPFERSVAPQLAGHSFVLDAEVSVGRSVEGVLYGAGGHHGGYCWYLADAEMRLEVAQSSIHTCTVAVPVTLAPGRHRLTVAVEARGDLTGLVTLSVDGREVGAGEVGTLLRRMPIGTGRTWIGRSGAPTVSGRVLPPAMFTGVLHEMRVVVGDACTDPDHADRIENELREQ